MPRRVRAGGLRPRGVVPGQRLGRARPGATRAGARRRRTDGGTASRARRRVSPRATPSGPSSRPSPSLPTCRPTPSPSGATAGQVDKVAAVGIDVALADGATLDGLTLRLKESDASGANVARRQGQGPRLPGHGPLGRGPERQLAGPSRRRLRPGLRRGRPGSRRHLDVRPGRHRPALGRSVRPRPGLRRRPGHRPGGSPSPVQVSWVNFETGSIASRAGCLAPHRRHRRQRAGRPRAGRRRPGRGRPPDLPSRTPLACRALDGGQRLRRIAGLPVRVDGRRALHRRRLGERSHAGVARRTDPERRARPRRSRASRRARRWASGSTSRRPPLCFFPSPSVSPCWSSVTLGPAGRPSPVLRREGGLSRALARRNPGSADAAPDRRTARRVMRHRSAQVAVARGAVLTLALVLAAACGQKAGVGTDTARRAVGGGPGGRRRPGFPGRALRRERRDRRHQRSGGTPLRPPGRPAATAPSAGSAAPGHRIGDFAAATTPARPDREIAAAPPPGPVAAPAVRRRPPPAPPPARAAAAVARPARPPSRADRPRPGPTGPV